MFALGLVGKLEVVSTWSATEIKQQLSDMFLNAFILAAGCNTLEFDYLGSVPGIKLLQKPAVNEASTWDEAAVLSNSRGIVHILASALHKLKKANNPSIVSDKVCKKNALFFLIVAQLYSSFYLCVFLHIELFVRSSFTAMKTEICRLILYSFRSFFNED